MMAKNTRKWNARRGLSLLMILVMLLGIVPLQAFAAKFENQVMDGYYQIDVQNNITGTTSTAATTGHGFTLEKTLTQTGENTFDVTLKVVTSQTVTTNDAAVQLIIDLSNSMAWCASCGGSEGHAKDCKDKTTSRLEAVKEALTAKNGFLDTLVSANTGKVFVSVIYFGTNAGVVHDWVDIKDANQGANNLQALKNAINRLSTQGGTNLDAGLMLARNRLSMDTVAGCGNKYTVLLSDGEPTYRTSKSSTSTSSIENSTNDGSGSKASAAELDQAETMATQVKALSTLYTICYGEAKTTLSVSNVHVCAHCEESKDKHVELCAHCGETKNEHNRIGMARFCEGTYTLYEGALYCDRNRTNVYTATTGTNATVTVGSYLKDQIATAATGTNTYAYDASDAASVSTAFANVASATVAGMNGNGTTVTDPMGDYILLGNVSGIQSNGSTLTWELNPENATVVTEGNTTTYTYTLRYPITLDTAAEGFQETDGQGNTKYYPANKYTYLSVLIDGEKVEIPFNIPAVCGKIPQKTWKVEYYLQGDAAKGDYASYTLDDSADMGAVKLHTTVNAPAGYQTKYAAQDYAFAGAGATSMKISENGENIMRLYYNRITADVTVNHYYKTDIIDPNGQTISGAYPEKPNKTETETVNVNTSYTANTYVNYGGYTYTLVEVKPSQQITVTANGKNEINLYYSRLDDQRAVTSAEVKHVYTTYTYVVQNGKYVLIPTASVTETAESATNLRATTVFGVSPNPLNGYADFRLNTNLGDYAALLQSDNSLSFTVADNAADNVRTLYFEKVVDNRQAATVTVNHHYTKTVTTVIDGQAVTVTNPDNVIGKTESFDAYIGESFLATQYNTYLNETYVSDAGNAAKLEINPITGDVTIDLYYTLVRTPETVSITVNHYWRTFTEVTVERIDPATGKVIGTATEQRVNVDHKEENITVENLYEGQTYLAALATWGEGYRFNSEESNQRITVTDGAVINLYYDRDTTDDARNDASIDVLHQYYTQLTTVIAGEVCTVRVPSGTALEQYPTAGQTLKAGDSFTATAQPQYEGNTYRVTTAADALTTVLQPGTNGTIVIEYLREDSDLVEVPYTVNYAYRTYTMTVNEQGVAGYHLAPTVDRSTTQFPGCYVGQQITLIPGGREGFTALESNPGTAQVLTSGNNEWTFVYERYIPLETGTVTVNHHYETTTVGINGVSTVETASVNGVATVKYLGETYLAQSVPNGYTLVSAKVDGNAAPAADMTVIVTGDNVVDFYYKKTVDNSVLVNYSIAHIYKLYNAKGELIATMAPEKTTGTGYATTTITAAPAANGYVLKEATYNGTSLEAPYTVTLRDGTNDIVFVYELMEEPVVTEPPVTEPPVTEPPVTEPPVTEPPVTEPPVTEPPVTEPPVTEPPLVEIEDEDTPLSDNPKTGDPITLYAVAGIVSGAALGWMGWKRKKEEDEEV